MFTGIIQNQGKVIRKKKNGGQVSFIFRFRKPEKGFKIGSSMAVNGVCLTATQVKKTGFQVDVIKETLEATTLGNLKLSDLVNLERSLRYGDEMGGHFVTGHIDGKGKLLGIKKHKKNLTYTFDAPPQVVPYLAPKGSIAIDGISLTVQQVKGSRFTVGIIPHTKKVTSFRQLKAGGWVNLEIDLVARYLKALDSVVPAAAKSGRRSTKSGRARSRKVSGITLKSLLSQGF